MSYPQGVVNGQPLTSEGLLVDTPNGSDAISAFGAHNLGDTIRSQRWWCPYSSEKGYACLQPSLYIV